MKRSEINKIIDDSIKFIEKHKFLIPGFSYWSPEDWENNKVDCVEVKDNMLGWDITDFGSNNFKERGLVMLTTRNGNQHKTDIYKKPYAEKLLITEEGQETPMHFHFSKMEDIINRGGGVLIVELWNSDEDYNYLDSDVVVSMDGKKITIKAGEKIIVNPGQSITLEPGIYHRFYGKNGTGKILLGEISSVNDDLTDNHFFEKLPRFPSVVEDEPVQYPLFSEL
jgi:hypothetical protein